MVTKGIITEVISDYKAKVRIPLYDSIESAKGSTLDKDLSIATVCTLPNLTHPVDVGDVVYVSFEDGDKSKPVILGHLYKENKTKTKVNLDVGNITTNSTTQLGYQTSIGNIRPTEIARLAGVKDNIQNQIDINLPAINFAESERQKSETDGAITHNGDASVVFAESERQKSKNLLNKDLLKKGCYIFVTGQYDYNDDYMTSEPISVTPNSTITISCNGFEFNSNCGFVFFNNGVYVGYLSNGATVATVPANANQVIYDFHKENITKDDIQYAQLEYGSVATDYQPYDGLIVHEKQLPKITTLWTNPNPSNDFSSQTITLANDNYDYAIMICAGRNNELDTQVSFFFEKGTAPILNYVLTNTDAAYSVENLCRRVVHTNNTTLNIGNCTYSLKLNSAVVANNLLIPHKVIGIKIGD